MPVKEFSPRKGIPVTYSLDADAIQLIRAMCPCKRGFGLFVSELVRKEARERLARSEWVARLRSLAEAASHDER